MRILAGGSCEMRESPAKCVRVGNYVILTMINFIDGKDKFIFTKNILSFSTHSNFFLYKKCICVC